MEKFLGKTVFDGIAEGRISFYSKKEQIIKREHINDKEA